MKENTKHSQESIDNTNPFPIYPDIDQKIDPSNKKVTLEEIIQETEMINPDPNTLDRG